MGRTGGLVKPATAPAGDSAAGGRWAGGGRLAALRVAFGLVWLVDASFKWSPSFVTGFTGYLTGARDGQPAVVRTWLDGWIHVVGAHPAVFARAVAVTESLVAVTLILGLVTNAACAVGGILSLAIWSTAEGFGGPYAPGSTDIGASIIYVILFGALWASRAGATFSVDAALRPRLRRWAWLCAAPPGARTPPAAPRPRRARAWVAVVLAASVGVGALGLSTALGPHGGTAPGMDAEMDSGATSTGTPSMTGGGQDAMDPGGQGTIHGHHTSP